MFFNTFNLPKHNKLFIPQDDKITPITAKEGKYIYSFLKKSKISKTLEVGLAYGVSAAYIISATKSVHCAIDPFQDSLYDGLGIKNLKELGLDKYLSFKNDYSHNVLPALFKENKKFDFIFIDGDHKFDSVFIDYYYSDLLLKKQGYIIFHDVAHLPAIKAAVSWVKNNRKDYSFINSKVANLAIFQKNGLDDRKWDHFCPFFV